MKKSPLRIFRTALALVAIVTVAASSARAQDTLRSFTDVGQPGKKYRALHAARKVVNGNYTKDFDYGFSVEEIASDSRHYWRRSLTMAPGTQYIERFLWDPIGFWAYLDVVSEARHIQGVANTFPCNSSDLRGCDYVSTAGQRWVYNSTVNPAQGLPTSPALSQWDSSTFGFGRAHIYFRDGVERTRVEYKGMTGQLWYRNEWGNNLQNTYPDHVNTAEVIGWTDPQVYRFAQIKLNPKRVFIVRQYSGCSDKPWAPQFAWTLCDVFEDHIYAKDAAGNAMGQVGFIAGFTPSYKDWYKLGNYFSVNHVMVFLEEAP